MPPIGAARAGASRGVFDAIPDSAIHQYDISALSLNDGETISSVPDQIGSTNLSAIGSPTYDADANGGAGGAQVDGSNGFETDNQISFSGGGTIYFVLNYDGGGQGDHYFIEGDLLYSVDAGPGDGLFNGSWIRRNNSTVQGTAIRGGFVNGVDSKVRRDGTQIESGDIGGDSINATLDIALTSSPASGALSEIIIYDSVLSQSEYKGEESRLADKYGVTLA